MADRQLWKRPPCRKLVLMKVLALVEKEGLGVGSDIPRAASLCGRGGRCLPCVLGYPAFSASFSCDLTPCPHSRGQAWRFSAVADRNTHLDSKETQDPKVVPDPFVLP